MARVRQRKDVLGSSANESQNKQDGEFLSDLSAAATDVTDNSQLHFGQKGLKMEDNYLLPAAPQNEVNGGSARINPFYTFVLESGSKSNGTEDVWRTSEDVSIDTIFVPPPEFRSSPLDFQQDSETVENGAKCSEPEKDLFKTLNNNHMQDLFQTSVLAQKASANGHHYHDITLNSPGVFETTQTQNLSNGSDLFKGEVDDIFQAAKEDGSHHAAHAKEVNLFDKSPSIFVDPFKSPLNKEDDLFQPPQLTVGNPFYSAMSKETAFFQDVPTESGPVRPKSSSMIDRDEFSLSSTSTFDPFPSPITRDLFQDSFSPMTLDDPFGTTKQFDPFQDISDGTTNTFKPLPPNTVNNSDVFKTPSESLSDIQTKSSNRPCEIALTTPQGTKHDILQATPFSQARNLSVSPSQSPAEMTHVQTFKRPPKPLPRTRPPKTKKPPRPEKPPKPANPIEPEPTVPTTPPKPAFRPLPKPVIRPKPATQEDNPVNPENYVVFEDILLTGQERCVEDWPEDSPELNPDFKPLKADSDGGSGDDQGGPGSHSKDKFPDDTKEGRSKTVRSSSKENFSEMHMSAGENDDREQNEMDYKKKPLKAKVNQLLRRASTTSSNPEAKCMNGQGSKDDDINKQTVRKKNSIMRRWSEGTVLDNSTGEDEDEGGEARHEEKRKKKMKIKFVPHRGFAITVEKNDDGLKGLHEYAPRKGSKEKSQEEIFGAHGYTPPKNPQEDMLDDANPKKNSFSVEELDDEELYGMEDVKPKKSKRKGPIPFPRKSKTTTHEAAGQSELIGFSHRTPQHAAADGFPEDEITQTGKDFLSPRELYDIEQDDLEICKPKKPSKLKGFKKHKAKSKAMQLEYKDPPGATSSDYLSEAAKAEWLAAQMDERAMAGLEDGDEEGDTDSLMEWWYTVEKWDEVPSDDEEKVLQEDESKSFTILADKVDRGLRVFNKVFTERAELLWHSIITLHAIADDISNFHHKAKIAGITGGTTTAVGGVTAIAGLALAPFTFGASLVVTAVGVGVATAGGITSASAAISDNVNNMHDRKKVEMVLQEYENHLLDIGKILHFVNQGMYKLRGHPFLRCGTQHYSEDWEVRRAVQMISLIDLPMMRAMEITDAAVVSVQGLFKGIDKYFIKDSRELKKGCNKEVVGQIKELANVLNDGIVELNSIREELQDATGNM
ncbi:hypothetical protein PAMA_013741 [Pampus argenteus]